MNGKTFSLLAAAMFLSIFLSGCCCAFNDKFFKSLFNSTEDTGGSVPIIPLQDEKAEWTYMVYMDGDNNLEEASLYDFLEIEKAGSSKNANVVVQWDRSKGYFKGKEDWSGARRYYITKGSGDWISSDYLSSMGEIDMADPKSLSDFVGWAIEKYPAKKYALVLWNHGGGWTSLLVDDGSNNSMKMPQFREAMSSINQKLGKKLDLLILDMCLMAQYDVMLEISPYADFMVGSEEVVPGNSFNYTPIINGLSSKPKQSSRELAILQVDEYGKYYENQESATTLSAMDLSKTQKLQTAFNDFTGELDNLVKNGKWRSVAEIHQYTENYPSEMGAEDAIAFSFGDLYDLASNAEAYSMDNPALAEKALALQKAVNETVIANYNHRRHSRSHGISYYFQPSGAIYTQMHSNSYPATSAYSDSSWKAFLGDYYSKEDMSTSPSVTDFQISPSASLARPIKFSYTMTGWNVIANKWVQFYDDNGVWKVSRFLSQKTITTLPNGKVVNGFSGGIGKGVGRSSPIEFWLSDGTKSTKASVEQMWPAQNYLVVPGMLAKNTGETVQASLIFSDINGSLAGVQVQIPTSDGQPIVSYLPSLDIGDRFTPGILYLSQNGLASTLSADTLTFSSEGFELDWRALETGTYAAADILYDISGKSGYATGTFKITKQPKLNPLKWVEMKQLWVCGQIEQGIRVGWLMTLNLTDGKCSMEDGAGSSKCIPTYSEKSIPHIYLYLTERFETVKFTASRINSTSFWLFDIAGSDPIYCLIAGGGEPPVSVYKELYASIGDNGADIDEYQADLAGLNADWESKENNMELSLKTDKSFKWEIGSNLISGTYSASKSLLNLSATSPSKEYSTSFYYIKGKKKLVLYDYANKAYVFNKKGQTLPSAPNDPAPVQTSQTQEQQNGQQTQQQTQQTQSANPSNLVGTWSNPYTYTTLMLGSDGSYILIDGYYYYSGAWSADSSMLYLSYGSVTTSYSYVLSGNALTCTGNGITITLTKS